MAVIGLILFLGAFWFKLAVFPFHFWAPDVYQGASNETAAFTASIPKAGALIVLIRFFALLRPGTEAVAFMAVLAAFTITYGNLAALVQTDIKRLLAYSSVAHAGYLSLGLVAGTPEGFASATYYCLIYILMNLACFWVVCRLSEEGENLTVADLDGLYRRNPVLAFVLAAAAFSLVGLPPTAGFMGKLFLFNSAWGRGYDWLVVVAAVNTAIAIYYYLNLVRHAYTREPAASHAETGWEGWLGGSLLAAGVLLPGIFPSLLFDAALNAGRVLMH